ncbi:hypothetical protein U8695_05005 [Aquirufa antheringensis]
MRLIFHNANELAAKTKATVHSSGKLGFSIETNKILELDQYKFMQIATNEDDENDLNLYAILHKDEIEGAFRLIKAGSYYNLNTKGLFDKLNVDYQNSTVIYDIVKSDYEGRQILKLLRRDIKKKTKAADKKAQ